MGYHGAMTDMRTLFRLPAKAIAAFVALAIPALAQGRTDYRADVQFAIDAIGKECGGLLRQKGIDWKKATKSLKGEAKKLKDPVEYVRLVERILARLQDGHAGIVKLAPDVEAALKAANEDEAKGRRWTGPRVHLLLAGDEVLVG